MGARNGGAAQPWHAGPPRHMIAIMSPALCPLFDGGTPLALAARAPLFHAGDRVGAMYLVTEGEIALVRHGAGGAAMILQRTTPGEVVAEASAYADRYHCSAVAAVETRLRTVPLAGFRERLDRRSDLAAAWAQRLARGMQSARMRAEIRGLRTVAERLDAWLDICGPLPPRGRWQGLAAELGVTPEALYRELARRRPPDSTGTDGG